MKLEVGKPKGDISAGLLRRILEEADISPHEWEQL